jgi:succinate dehydrogenase / fumarate reductase cytochrome b subunit
MADARAQSRRPISPHLQIYAPLINMVMSILHRLTGMALYAGSLLLAAWLIAAASGESTYNTVSGLFASWPGWLLLFVYSWVLLHHMLGGIRHFIWDTIHGLDIASVTLLCWGSLAGSLALTVLLWGLGLAATGTF